MIGLGNGLAPNRRWRDDNRNNAIWSDLGHNELNNLKPLSFSEWYEMLVFGQHNNLVRKGLSSVLFR